MENSLIEKIDKERYIVIQLVTIGFGIWFGSQILQDVFKNSSIELFIVLIEFIGVILFIVGQIKRIKLLRKINSSVILKEALNNEMYLLYIYKSLYIGFWAVIITSCCLYFISAVYDISAFLVCKIILFFGGIASFIAYLIFNKN